MDWSDYKTMRQYRSMGEVLDELKAFGFRTGVENILNKKGGKREGSNGHSWLTAE